ncbi:MAG: histidinol dehydrogenase [Alphaproteobacteria bacterium]|nr:histidinol dehydrogenase [Alphaproteobacteria bacterium]
MPRRLDSRHPDFAAAFAKLVDAKRTVETDMGADVAAILAEVRQRGDAALIEYTLRFDRLTLTAATLRVASAEIAAAEAALDAPTRAALRLAAERIAAYCRRQMPADSDYVDAVGARLGWRWTPIAEVGLYVPGGLAAYPSTVLMNAVPAKVAGVERLAMVVPAPDGRLNPIVLAAAHIAGVDEIWRIGGAQAIAALAHGTASIRPVDKIVGPGNAYVAEAKRQVFGMVGIDLIAGPSEILVVADGDNDPAAIAADLMSQAEHDENAEAVLITDDAGFADRVAAAVETVLASLPRRAIARASWERFGAIIRVASLDEAPALVDRLAPEHLELAVADPDALARRVRHAGAIFLGRFTPEAIGDYLGGPNHVLPTSRAARFASGLSVLDFLKRTSLLGLDRPALEALGPSAVTLARAEGLDGHALSVARRLGRND